MHNMLAMSSIDHRRILQLMVLIKKNILLNKFELVDHERRTRQNDGLRIKLPIPRNQHVKHALFYTGCQIWNNLPLNIRELGPLEIKKEIKDMLS